MDRVQEEESVAKEERPSLRPALFDRLSHSLVVFLEIGSIQLRRFSIGRTVPSIVSQKWPAK